MQALWEVPKVRGAWWSLSFQVWCLFSRNKDPGSIPGSGRAPGEGMSYPLWYSWASLVAQLVKNPPACGRPGFDPWLGRSPGEGKVYPLQYSGLENSMDCIAHGVTKSWTWLSDFHFLYSPIICWLALLSLELFHERRKGFRGQIHLKSVLSYSSSLGLHSANDHTEDSEVT